MINPNEICETDFNLLGIFQLGDDKIRVTAEGPGFNFAVMLTTSTTSL